MQRNSHLVIFVNLDERNLFKKKKILRETKQPPYHFVGQSVRRRCPSGQAVAVTSLYSSRSPNPSLINVFFFLQPIHMVIWRWLNIEATMRGRASRRDAPLTQRGPRQLNYSSACDGMMLRLESWHSRYNFQFQISLLFHCEEDCRLQFYTWFETFWIQGYFNWTKFEENFSLKHNAI